MTEHQRRRQELLESQKRQGLERDRPVLQALEDLDHPRFKPVVENHKNGNIWKLIVAGSGLYLYVHAYGAKWQVGFMLGFDKALRGRITSEQLVEALKEAHRKLT